MQEGRKGGLIMVVKGSCLCGGVRYLVDGPLRDVVACHCSQCRKQTGHYFAATDALDADMIVKDDDGLLKWYAASDEAKRGFCGTCGSVLFWKRNGSAKTSILAGGFDGDPGVKLERHIYCADKGAYYEIEGSAKKFAQGDVGLKY